MNQYFDRVEYGQSSKTIWMMRFLTLVFEYFGWFQSFNDILWTQNWFLTFVVYKKLKFLIIFFMYTFEISFAYLGSVSSLTFSKLMFKNWNSTFFTSREGINEPFNWSMINNVISLGNKYERSTRYELIFAKSFSLLPVACSTVFWNVANFGDNFVFNSSSVDAVRFLCEKLYKI